MTATPNQSARRPGDGPIVSAPGLRRIGAEIDSVWTEYVDEDVHDLAVVAVRAIAALADRVEGGARA
ncbi:MAG: hypothetical protein V4755_15355 [Curtobacterium sp.]